jgi:hypothetical protein
MTDEELYAFMRGMALAEGAEAMLAALIKLAQVTATDNAPARIRGIAREAIPEYLRHLADA